ncbi:tetratricopeptide repeat protein 21B-like [Lucilia cuprina]|uniref:tetratricopeptide repeat protein 21B-like n=1 Tax=Lucilia cuprina TaxID=7375 RepID=UPI001F05D2CA|nr:tetratricopeptide repeat protein 21B-like [Lucilia cuprina]XP_046806713.1 tetratricopeptide repeat protein 21B-like [Lucilia cuprina]XP_046806714.1 tetratricopeptide repeat protein 21B-like [Lucilia cuprina]
MLDTDDFESLLLYYGRSEYFHIMQKTALDGLARFPSHIVFRLYNGIALVLGNRLQEGIRELNPLKNDSDLGIGAIIALLYAHKNCSVVDRDAIGVLEKRLTDDLKKGSAIGFYNAAVFLFLARKYEKAREYVDKALKLDSHHEYSIVLKAWTEMCQAVGPVSGNILNTLEHVLAKSSKNIDSCLALVKYYQLRGEFENAINNLNKLSVRFPELNIPLIEKMNTHLAVLDWDHAYETALRIINLEPTNIPALQVKALLLITREGNMKGGISTLQQLLVATERVESSNSKIILKICQLFAHISSRNVELLSLTLRFIDKLIQANPSGVEYIVELGNERMLLGNVKEAAICYRSAIKIDSNNFNALCGLTACQLLEHGCTEQTQQQVEFLNELRPGDSDPLLLFLRAKITSRSDQAIALLIKATEIHMSKLESHAFGPEYAHIMNPEFLLQITAEFLHHSPVQVNIKHGLNLSQDTLHITLKHCMTILDNILKFCPSHIQAIFMRAKVHFLCGEVAMAATILQKILNDIDVTYTDAYLLLAQIQMQQQQYSKALQSLELALSYNFAIRENPRYYLLMGIGQRHQQQYTEAQKSFISAMHLVGNETSLPERIQSPNSRARTELLSNFTVADKVTLYLELISTYKDIGDSQGVYESERLLQCAMEEFNETSEEGRLVIAHAEFMLQNANVNKAIDLLSAIQPGQSYYIQAKTHLANIHLQYRKDRIAFARCFKELVENCPESESYLMLGEAYMSIQEPDLAVEAYQKALELNPHDSHLASKLGRAYVKTHQYVKAIQFYQEALKNQNHECLNLNLAELFLKLRQFKSAEEVLTKNEDQKQIELLDIDGLQLRTKRLLLLARVHEKAGNKSIAMHILKEAKENQYRIQKRISVDQSGSIEEQNKTLSKICLLMAQHSINLRNNEQALSCFKECLKYTPNDIEVLTSLGRLYMQMNAMEMCRDVCLQILQIDSNHEAASVMMADLSFRKMDFENAAYHFSQLLLAQPCYWTALARLIEVMRRSGSLLDVMPFLQRAEQGTQNPNQAPGLNYCKGLYEWYNGNPNGALRYFNAARRDFEWGPQAIFNMIEICINPDGDIPNGSDILDNGDSGDFSDARAIALRTADRLLKELRPRPIGLDNETLNHRLLQNFLKLASKQKFQIESALQDFTELAGRDEFQCSVGPILGMATGLVQLKQTQRAKNHLKRLARVSWNFEEAEYLERSWLLLADIYVNANKWDVAEGLVDKVLQHNKSSAKAYELSGYIAEKSQNYREAAKNYNNAWNCCGRSKPHIGYKLAYNHMKIKRFADAIEICQQVLKLHPDYTIIRKDILEKCRNSLRP